MTFDASSGVAAGAHRFGQILAETMAEVEAAEAIDDADARQAQDEVEQLRLRAAQLVSRQGGGPWHTGAVVQFQQDPWQAAPTAPTMDIRYPSLPPRADATAPAEPGAHGAAGRQGRRVPQPGSEHR
ncbi:MAG: hypothetical protein LCH84_06705 [Gemmatimonadetes bacterium]|nr:hypothetical protein [Gemmatimonadota bacterium]